MGQRASMHKERFSPLVPHDEHAFSLIVIVKSKTKICKKVNFSFFSRVCRSQSNWWRSLDMIVRVCSHTIGLFLELAATRNAMKPNMTKFIFTFVVKSKQNEIDCKRLHWFTSNQWLVEHLYCHDCVRRQTHDESREIKECWQKFKTQTNPTKVTQFEQVVKRQIFGEIIFALIFQRGEVTWHGDAAQCERERQIRNAYISLDGELNYVFLSQMEWAPFESARVVLLIKQRKFLSHRLFSAFARASGLFVRRHLVRLQRWPLASISFRFISFVLFG